MGVNQSKSENIALAMISVRYKWGNNTLF